MEQDAGTDADGTIPAVTVRHWKHEGKRSDRFFKILFFLWKF